MVVALCHPTQYAAGRTVGQQVKQGVSVRSEAKKRPGSMWQSCYSAFQLISNRSTIAHRDIKGEDGNMDLLAAAGTYSAAWFNIHDASVQLSYTPGDVVLLAGKLLEHSVESWTGGERLCFAHFVRARVQEKFKFREPRWETISDWNTSAIGALNIPNS